MSLVHEALEKAAREKQRKTGLSGLAVPPAGRSPAAGEDPAKSSPTEKPLGETTKPLTTAPAPVSAPAPKTSHGLLTIVISCVGLVAIVAIVYLVMRATTTTPPAPAVDEGSRSSATVSGPAVPPPAVAPSGLGVSPKSSAPDKPTGETPVPPAPVADTAAYKLSGIMKDPEGKYCAVLNGRVVYEEHYVEGATVRKIDRDRITLDINGRETVIRLF